jgi:glycosyltransferase involved in cell wall biosynthesis
LEEAGIPVHFVGMKPGKLPSPGKIWNLVRLVRRLNPRLIHGWMYHGNLAAQFVNCFVFPKPPLIWSIHYSLDEWKGEKKMTKKMIGLGAGLSRRPAKIIYVSQVSCTQHRSIGYDDKRACVIPNGVDPAFFVPSGEARRAVRSELGLGQADFVIGLLARYHPMKDHENFLRAAALLSARYPDLHFVLAGTNVDHRNQVLNDLIRQGGISDRVHLMGERRDSHRILAAMDLFSLSSSNAEAFPMVLLEAMSCGLPCVTTQVGDAPQIVGDTGLVAPPRDPIALADAWESLIRDGAEKRRALGEAARERIINNYSLSWVVSTYEKLYQDIIGRIPDVKAGNRNVTNENEDATSGNQDATAGNPGKTMMTIFTISMQISASTFCNLLYFCTFQKITWKLP